MNRIVEPELLDALPPADPRAIRSRRDLRRVNSWMRNHSIMADALKNNLFGHEPKTITEIGAGDGDFLLRVAKLISPQWTNLNATLLDRQKIVNAETLAAFENLGWHAESVVADVFNWPQTPTQIVVANLFLHHFEDARLAELMRTISECAELFIAVEPHRFRYALPCGQLIRLIGCNAVTRHDAVVSVRAGFLGNELSALWPSPSRSFSREVGCGLRPSEGWPDGKNWRLTERRAGLFSHLFVAQKIS